MDGIPDFARIADEFRRFRERVDVAMETAPPSTRVELQGLARSLDQHFATLQAAYPTAANALEERKKRILERATNSQKRIAGVRAEIAKRKQEPAVVAAPPPPVVDPNLGPRLRADILKRFGKTAAPAPRPHGAEAVADMSSAEFQSFSSADVSVQALPTWMADVPAKAHESFGDMAAASLTDFEADEKKSKERSGKIEGLPEDLWKD